MGCRKEGNFNATAGYNNLVAAAAGRGIGKEQPQEGILAELLGRGFLVRQQLSRTIVGSSSSCGFT